MEEEDFVGCISCMSTTDLYDLFAKYTEDVESYAKMLEECYTIKVTNDLKYICALCADKLEKAASFKVQTLKNISIILSIQDEEYLDESILEEADGSQSDSIMKGQSKNKIEEEDEEYLDESILEEGEGFLSNTELKERKKSTDDLEDHSIEYLDETTCVYCSKSMACTNEVHDHVRKVHGIEPKTGFLLRECALCGAAMNDPKEHIKRCHNNKDSEKREYPCHFCENIYSSRKACFTHLRMKHGLKLSCEQTPKVTQRERHKCHMCGRDFSQKQILNKHLWRVHGFEVEKRKAFICPLCNERVSYGSHFSEHLLVRHRVHEQVDKLEFHNMDDFMLYKSAIQEETKCRFRKTTASKQTIEGLRSHYMCSQSGVYVYQGKGKRPAPERQIYKTGKACPAHMIVTETMDRVLVTFYKTHVGHGACPYYEPREPKKTKLEPLSLLDEKTQVKSESDVEDMQLPCEDVSENPSSWICDECGMGFLEGNKFKDHVTAHGMKLFPCQYCESVFQNIDAWTRHIRLEHNLSSLY